MKLNQISTLALNNGLRNLTVQKQVELNTAQYEVSSGKRADLGRQLGAFSSSITSFETQIKFIEQTKVTNSFVENRLETMQLSINSIVEISNNFVNQLTAELSGTIDKNLLKSLGDSSLSGINSALNVSFKGEFVFSGINTDSKSIVDYNGVDGAPAKTAVQTAFVSTFGFSTTDPQVSTITPSELEAFINGPFDSLFDDNNWETLWSGSSERGVRSKVSTQELVENPTTAHSQVFRTAIAATVLISELSDSPLNASTLNQLATSSISKMANSVGSLADEQSKIGVVQERVKSANERMDFQKDLLSGQLSSLTDVDAYEAALRLNQLSTSLQASYSVTARIQSLSLLNFI
jgi:flagellar hook-associated protein 3 FlgL